MMMFNGSNRDIQKKKRYEIELSGEDSVEIYIDLTQKEFELIKKIAEALEVEADMKDKDWAPTFSIEEVTNVSTETGWREELLEKYNGKTFTIRNSYNTKMSCFCGCDEFENLSFSDYHDEDLTRAVVNYDCVSCSMSYHRFEAFVKPVE